MFQNLILSVKAFSDGLLRGNQVEVGSPTRVLVPLEGESKETA